MKAAFFMNNGGPEVMQYGDVAEPVAGPGEVLVDVHAASINGADWKVRAGIHRAAPWFPYIPGRDFSGVVRAIGEGVRDFAPGDAVFGVCDVGQEGAYAEQVAVKAAILARKPSRISHIEAAAMALIGLTAITAIEDTLKLQAGETILITGGAGGVAGFALQLAKHIGARVITTASAVNHDYLRSLGTDQVIDYNRHDFTRLVSDCDAIFDTVGGETAQRSFAVLKPGGRAAFIGSGAGPLAAPRTDVQSLRPNVLRSRAHLDRITALILSGAVRVPEITLYDLSQAAQAHAVSQGRHLRGKLVLKVR